MARAALILALSGCATAQYVSVPWPKPSATPLNVTLGYATVKSTGTRFNWYISVLDDLSRLSVQLPAAGCNTLNTTTSTANLHNCAVATNAGFFQFTPNPTYCMGELVIDGKIQQWANDGSPLFALSAATRTTYFGNFTKADVASLQLSYAVSGFGMLVQDGRVHAAGVSQATSSWSAHRASTGPRAEEIAPRTIVAVDAAGRVLLVAVDGVEKLYLGLTVSEAAEVMAGGADGFPYTALHALNLDGGGSTTMSTQPAAGQPAQVFNRPTSTDTGPIVERGVTCIACISA